MYEKKSPSRIRNLQSLRVLMVESSEDDELLLIRKLKKGGYDAVYERVETAAAMKKALKEKQWDIILCDYSLPKFNAPSAIAILKKANIGIPIIIVSGTIGEIVAIDCMRLGARDYIMKGNLSRLCPAIARELKKAKVRNNEKHTEEKLHHEELRFQALIEHSSDIIVIINREGIITYINPAVEIVLGFKPEERIGAKGLELVHPDDMKFLADSFNTLTRDTNYPIIKGEMHLRHKDGSWRTFEGVGSNLVINNVVEYVIVNYRDITERKLAEDALHQSEEKYRTILESTQEGYFEVDLAGNFTFFNDAMCRLYGYSKEEMMDMNYRVYTDKENAKKLFQTFNKVYKTGEPTEGFDWKIIRKNRTKIYIEASASLQKDSSGKPIGFKGIVRDVTERKLADAKLQQTLEILRKAVGTTTQVLISALEARDPYTAGHQVRSADLARAIATEMGLPHDKIDGIRLAGSIHDIGKLSIPAEILSKPSKLTNIEFSLIKEHSHSGYEMLKDMESRWPLAQIIYQHHERINGSGYPRNLKGDEIIIEARIMAVADVVESMASHRPYRPALGIDAALEEIEKNKGILYDNDVVDSCLRLFRKKGYSLILKNTWGRRGGCQ
jgi:PAS domain S-box-containing protein